MGSLVQQLHDGVHAFLSGPSQASARTLGMLLPEVQEELELWQSQTIRTDGGGDSYQTFVVQLLECNLPVKLLACLEHLDFEARKIAAQILSDVIEGRRETGDRIVEYARAMPKLANGILDICVQEDVFFLGSQVARAATRCPQLVEELLADGFLLKLLDLCFHQCFEISNEIFALLREFMMNQKRLSAESLAVNFYEFFDLFHLMLKHESDYVLKRQALKLLGGLLLDKEFKFIMKQYVQNEHFLQIHMKLLRDSSQTIPLDAFHIFKLFVANPKKPKSVHTIISRNTGRLVKVLETFKHRQNDDVFGQDLDTILNMLDELPSQ